MTRVVLRVCRPCFCPDAGLPGVREGVCP